MISRCSDFSVTERLVQVVGSDGNSHAPNKSTYEGEGFWQKPADKKAKGETPDEGVAAVSMAFSEVPQGAAGPVRLEEQEVEEHEIEERYVDERQNEGR